MAKSKKELFLKKDIEFADLAKSLSHPARVMIINVLSKHKDRTCKELVFDISLSQPSVSRHLSDLLKVGLICRKSEGKKSLYTIEWNKLERFYELTARMSRLTMPNRPKRNCC